MADLGAWQLKVAFAENFRSHAFTV
jgi:hypothetical protein